MGYFRISINIFCLYIHWSVRASGIFYFKSDTKCLDTPSPPYFKGFSFGLFLLWTRLKHIVSSFLQNIQLWTLPSLDSSYSLQPGTTGQRKEGNTGSWADDLEASRPTNQKQTHSQMKHQADKGPRWQQDKDQDQAAVEIYQAKQIDLLNNLVLNSSRRDLVTAALVLGWVTCNYMQYNQ